MRRKSKENSVCLVCCFYFQSFDGKLYFLFKVCILLITDYSQNFTHYKQVHALYISDYTQQVHVLLL